GAANTAANVRGLGANVRLIAVIGDDDPGRQLLEALSSKGIDTDAVLCSKDRGTLSKARVLSGAQMLLRFDSGSTCAISEKEGRELERLVVQALAWADALIVSDYGYGVLTPSVLDLLAAANAQSGRLVVVD